MDEGFTWRVRLSAPPSSVFCSIVRAASEAGRVCGVEEYGSALVFTFLRQDADTVGRMRASVSSSLGGTLVTIASADTAAGHPVALAVQAQAVAALVRQLRVHYEDRNPISSAGEPVLAESADFVA